MINKSKNLKLFFIDDDKTICTLIEEYFSDEGYNIQCTSSAIEAINILKNNAFDIVVTDIRMPDIDGIEILSWIKENKPEIEVIIVTGHGSMESAIRAMKIGSYDYLQKPFRLNQLKIIIDNIAEDKHHRKHCYLSKKIKSDIKPSFKNYIQTQSLDRKLPYSDIYPFIVGGLLHDMFNQLNGLLGNIDLLKRNVMLQPNINENVNKIDLIANNIGIFIKYIRDLSRPYYSDKASPKDNCIMSSVAKKIVKQFEYEHKIKIKFTGEKTIPALRIPESIIIQLISELIANSLKQQPISKTHIKIRIAFQYYKESKTLKLSFLDNGPGYPQEILKKQENFLNEIGYPSGLYFISEIANRLDGKVFLSNRSSGGARTTIILTIPIFED